MVKKRQDSRKFSTKNWDCLTNLKQDSWRVAILNCEIDRTSCSDRGDQGNNFILKKLYRIWMLSEGLLMPSQYLTMHRACPRPAKFLKVWKHNTPIIVMQSITWQGTSSWCHTGRTRILLAGMHSRIGPRCSDIILWLIQLIILWSHLSLLIMHP